MVLTPDRSRRTAGTVSLLAALLLVLQALFLGAAATAAEPLPLPDPADNPTVVAGNPDCETYGLDEITRFEPVNVATDTVLSQDGVTITITDHKEEPTESLAFTWTSDSWVSAVLVKAGNDANVYSYDPSVKSGSAVTIGNTGISHITFCLGEEPPVIGEPSGELGTACGTWSADVAVSEGDAEATGTHTFEVREGATVLDTTTLGAGESDTLGGTFTEDSGVHDIVLVLVDGDTDTTLDTGSVETDCEPTEVTAAVPSITNPTCDVPNGTLTLPEVEGVSYGLVGSVGPNETITVTATAEPGYTLVGDTEWSFTFGPAATGCDETEVEPDVIAPAAAVGATCDGVTATLDNTESTEPVTFTVVINGNEQTITVPAGASDAVSAALGNGDSWSAVIAAGDTVLADGGDTEDCTVEVLPNVVEKPQPAPAVAPAAQELPATGLGSTELLLMALLLMGLGGTMLLAPQARREI